MGKKILVVDDSNAIRQSLCFILDREGFTVTPAEDGLIALGKLDSDKFDLVISDVNMPNLDGIGLTKKIRQNSSHKFTPVLMLTTESQSDMMQAGKEAGATGWIVKPFDQEKILAVIRKLIG